ncbi:uncharacterized protein LOC111636470 [Centruroides sculpturatus]|uniref:uncharacterized protein LOC111636470 n=1 Tax=Centruroides sculpturatus TaxID=218467 RepID=UPI000C6F0011|nr:uncharacterized protein LOC111636470 [Centruroides sculpturatus]
MSNLIGPHDNAERIIDKTSIESYVSGSALYQVEDILSNESRDTVFDIFNQSLSDTICCHNFDQFSNQSLTNEVNFTENSQPYHINSDKYNDFKSEMRKFQLNKVWPDQLDILAGPLLEDDDDCYSENNSSTCGSETNKVTDTKTNGETALILNSAMTAGIVQFGIDRKMFHIDSIDYKNDKIHIYNKSSELGRIIKLSRVEDDDEEIDIVTVDDDNNIKDNSQSCMILKSNNNEQKLISQESRTLPINTFNNNKDDLENNRIDENEQSLYDSEKSNETVLVAPDLNSLLEQFEATQETNEHKDEENENKEFSRSKMSADCEFTPKGTLASSVIERIKSSMTPARGTIMISHETVLNSTSPHKLVSDCCTKFQNLLPLKRNMPSSSSPNKDSVKNAKKIIFSSADHDYCSTETYYNKIPDYLTELKPQFGISSKIEMEEKEMDINIDDHEMVENKNISEECVDNEIIQSQINKTTNVPLSSVDYSVSKLVENSIDSNCNEIETKFPSVSSSKENLQIISKIEKTKHFLENLPDELEKQNFEVSSSKFSDFQLRKYHSSSENNSPNRSPLNYALPRRSRSRSPSKHLKKFRNRERTVDIQSFPYHEKSKEKIKQLEERRVVYVGNIPKETTRTQLLERFGKFGPIQEITLHFKEHGENYGFITFHNRTDAYKAIDCGNDNYSLPKLHLSFGGRRQFCKSRYSDLDSQFTIGEEQFSNQDHSNMDFDSLLKVVKAQQNSKFSTTNR